MILAAAKFVAWYYVRRMRTVETYVRSRGSFCFSINSERMLRGNVHGVCRDTRSSRLPRVYTSDLRVQRYLAAAPLASTEYAGKMVRDIRSRSGLRGIVRKLCEHRSQRAQRHARFRTSNSINAVNWSLAPNRNTNEYYYEYTHTHVRAQLFRDVYA